MVLAAVAAGAAPIIGAMYGQKMSEGDMQAAREAEAAALAQWSGIQTPEYDYSQLSMPTYENLAAYSPEQEFAIQMGPSAMGQISLDPATREAQMLALSRLSEIGSEGLTAEDEFRMAQMQQELGRQERGSREALTQQMAQRGMAGGGLELAGQLAQQQASAERSRMEGLGIQAQAQRRALEGIQAAGSLGGEMRGQDFSEAQSVAAAKDAIARFNAQQRSQVQSSNVGARNLAQQTNLANQENRLDKTYGYQLGQQQYANDLIGQSYQDKIGLASGKAGAYGTQAAGRRSEAQSTRDMYAGVGRGVGQGFATYGASN